MLKEITEWVAGRYPTTLPFPRTIGVENEYAVVNASCEASRGDDVLMTLKEEIPGASELREDELVYGIALPNGGSVSYDASWSTLEHSSRPVATLQELSGELMLMERRLARAADRCGKRVLAYGQPYSLGSRDMWVPRKRYMEIVPKLPPPVDLATIFCSTQVHVAVAREELVPARETFECLTALIVHLFARSPIWGGKSDPFRRVAARADMFVEIDSTRAGVAPERITTLEDAVRPIVEARRFGPDPNEAPVSFLEWARNGGRGEWQAELLRHHTSVWTDVRYHLGYGTIEFRVPCSQRYADAVAIAAILVGVVECLGDARTYVERWERGFWNRLRAMAVRGQEDLKFYQLVPHILDIAGAGLRKRGLDEEDFLEPAWEYFRNNNNPAALILSSHAVGGMKRVVDTVALQP